MVTPDLGRLFSAIASPVDTEGSLPAGVTAQLVQAHVDRGVEGIYCCGSSGEGLLLRPDERMRLVEEVSMAVGDSVPVIAHVGTASTRDSIQLAQHAERVGAVAVSMIPPIYYHYSTDEIMAHYRRVMDAVSIPMIVYNIPQFTGQEFGAEHPLLAEDRVVGVKHTAHSMYQLERMSAKRPDLQLINGFDETYLSATVAGASGAIGTTISLQTDCFKAIRSLLGRGDVARAQQFQARVNHVIEDLVAVGVFPAAKYVESRLTGIDLGPCREPFAPVSPEGVKRLDALVEQMTDDAMAARAVLAES
ncbi:dihydrodipicolinate synthase family protein [Tessaracoccus aquimaris]|uniref:dihydrodipicolinate synthase family protein n=1 Tax=Tessaracoccus aquimaris TaxID=1332264 RepID=UPI0013140548|nr:dihydrodipicolinate synthase family protein [Tessaracoccus aquimaris]